MKPIKGKLLAIVAFAALIAGMAWCVISGAKKNDGLLAKEIAAKMALVEAQAKYATELAEYADRVIELPEDGANWHTTVFTATEPTPHERQLLSWFDGDQRLAKLKSSTHFHHYTPASSVYPRYSNVVSGGQTAVMVQDASGVVVYKVSGEATPKEPWPLFKGIKECIQAHCPHLRPCPCPTPPPGPAPSPSPQPGPSPIPDVGPPDGTSPFDAKDETLAIVLLFAGAIVVGFLLSWKKGTNTPF
ncbi:MAG TPA: hypothetical protein VND64_33735 [Pirellulales bacterium]|nr:hypothetical protein [Pirellulales bacterium]